MIRMKLPQAMDASMEIFPPNSKPRSRPLAPAAPAKSRAPKELTPVKVKVPVVTKRRSVPSTQPRKPQVFKKEKIVPSHDREKPPKPARVNAAPKLPPTQKQRVAEPESEESDLEPEFSVSDEEREVVIKNARRRLEQLLAETTSLVDELEKMEDDVQRLQEEKVALLDELLECEGLAVNPYPPFRPLTRKIKLIRNKC